MKELDTMSLAWKIFKAQKLSSFSYALKRAWIIIKSISIKINNELLEIKTKIELYGFNKTNSLYLLEDNSYNINLLQYQFRG